MKYCKLLIHNSYWWKFTCSKSVEDNVKWNKLLRKVCIMLVFLTINTPTHLTLYSIQWNYKKKTNGILHSLKACEQRTGPPCARNWTEPHKSTSTISNKAIRFSAQNQVQVQDSHSTTSIAIETSRLCCHKMKCKWSGAKWNSCTDPREQVLRWQMFPSRVAVCECLQSRGPELLQLMVPEIYNAIFSHW